MHANKKEFMEFIDEVCVCVCVCICLCVYANKKEFMEFFDEVCVCVCVSRCGSYELHVMQRLKIMLTCTDTCQLVYVYAYKHCHPVWHTVVLKCNKINYD